MERKKAEEKKKKKNSKSGQPVEAAAVAAVESAYDVIIPSLDRAAVAEEAIDAVPLESRGASLSVDHEGDSVALAAAEEEGEGPPDEPSSAVLQETPALLCVGELHQIVQEFRSAFDFDGWNPPAFASLLGDIKTSHATSQLEDLDQSLRDFEDELCVEFGSCLWADARDDECPGCDKDSEKNFVEAIADVLLEDDILLLQGAPCSGTSDRDAVEPGQLSPMFRLVVVGENVSIERLDEFNSLAKKSKCESPLRKIDDKWNQISSYFRSSFRIQGMTSLTNWEDASSQFTYGTGFFVSEKHMVSALHLHEAEGRTVLAWRGLQVAASVEQFEDNKLPRYHFKALPLCIDESDLEMVDPITKHQYDLAKLSRVDAATWEIISSSMYNDIFVNPRNAGLLKRADTFLIPMSMELERVYKTIEEDRAACGMVHYGMVKRLRDELCAQPPTDLRPEETKACMRERIKFFLSHCQIMAEEMQVVLQGQSLKDWFTTDRGKASKQLHSWFVTMKDKLLNLTMHKKDGDMLLGTGRVVGVNCTMLAHTISAFPGSSGGAVFLIDGVAGCFVGIHIAPASISKEETTKTIPDHNVACNVENAVFGRMFFQNVLGNLSAMSVGDRASVLYRFIGYHLPTILAAYPLEEWSNTQTIWLKEAISYLANPPSEIKKDLRAEFDEDSKLDSGGLENYKKWRLTWKQALQDAGQACIKTLGAEMLLEEF